MSSNGKSVKSCNKSYNARNRGLTPLLREFKRIKHDPKSNDCISIIIDKLRDIPMRKDDTLDLINFTLRCGNFHGLGKLLDLIGLKHSSVNIILVYHNIGAQLDIKLNNNKLADMIIEVTTHIGRKINDYSIYLLMVIFDRFIETPFSPFSTKDKSFVVKTLPKEKLEELLILLCNHPKELLCIFIVMIMKLRRFEVLNHFMKENDKYVEIWYSVYKYFRESEIVDTTSLSVIENLLHTRTLRCDTNRKKMISSILTGKWCYFNKKFYPIRIVRDDVEDIAFNIYDETQFSELVMITDIFGISWYSDSPDYEIFVEKKITYCKHIEDILCEHYPKDFVKMLMLY